VHVPDDLRVPEVPGDVTSGVDVITVALQARGPAGVVPLLGYEVRVVGSGVPALFVRRGVEDPVCGRSQPGCQPPHRPMRRRRPHSGSRREATGRE
jgi:hypothetical protein